MALHTVSANYHGITLDVEIETYEKGFDFVRIVPVKYSCNCQCKELFEAEQNRLINILNRRDDVVDEITEIIKADFAANKWAACDRGIM